MYLVTLHEFSLFLLSILTSAAGQFLLKTGALKIGKLYSDNIFALILRIFTTPELLAGLTCYGVGVIAYILLLSRVKLSIAGPALALGYVFSVLLGYFVFKETLPFRRMVGLGLIIAGVVLVIGKD